jgi:hypothetical protein
MSGATRQNVPFDSVAYADSWDHLCDELRCLDLRLQLEVLKQPRHETADPLALFRDLVITDEEIDHLLARQQGAASDPTGTDEQEKLRQATNRLQMEIQARRTTCLEEDVYLSLPRLAEIFGLTAFEEQCLMVCLAPEVDRKYEKLYAYLQDDATRKKPSVDLILRLLCGSERENMAARAAFSPHAALLKFKLLQINDSGNDGPLPLLARTVKLDDRIVNFLLGHRQIDAHLERFAHMIFPHEAGQGLVAENGLYRQTVRFVEEYFRNPGTRPRSVILYLYGKANQDKRLIVAAASRNFDLPLLVADVEAMKASPVPLDQLAWLLAREALLQTAALCLENCDCLLGEPEKHLLELKSLIQSARTFSRLTFIFGNEHWQPKGPMPECLFLALAAPPPDLPTCKYLWEHGLAACKNLVDDVDSSILAGKFRFGISQIQQALASAEGLARWRSPENWRISAKDLHAACRSQATPKLGALTRKIEPKYSWDDIVLPEDNIAQMRELCQQAQHRHTVYGEWGFDRKLSLGKGLNALFSGPPGTGKTMAAEVIANELQLDLYRIDLSQVVSKYIGETEKNLHQIFQESQGGNAILFFDEADALFGKRSEVKDAHDRYANIEVGYLLQKMEEHEGVAILATNLSQHIDEAFLRRMHFIIEFPFPDQEYRKRIWQVMFPREAPLSQEVDFESLAREIKLPGGNIKNIALAAAFYAAGNGRVIRMPHLWHAARREHQKLGRTWDETVTKTLDVPAE